MTAEIPAPSEHPIDPPAPEAPAPQPRTNTLAIVSLASSFFVGLAGVVCGLIALTQVKRSGERGRGLAIAGIVVGAAQVVISAVVAVLIASAIALGAAVSSASDYSKIPDLLPGGETIAQCAGLQSTIAGWSSDLDPTVLAIDPEAGLKKLEELRDDLQTARDTIIDRDLSEAVDSAVDELGGLIEAAEPYNTSLESMTPEVAAEISAKLGSTIKALKLVGTVCTTG